MMRICEQPLARVEFVRHPDFDTPQGGEATYYVPAAKRGGLKSHTTAGGVFGKLILVCQGGRNLDPAFLVVKIDGRYYIEANVLIAADIANSLNAGAEPDWTGAALGEGRRVLKNQ